MFPLEFAKKVQEATVYYSRLTSEKQWFLFAHVIVPVLVVSYWLVNTHSIFPQGNAEEKVSCGFGCSDPYF